MKKTIGTFLILIAYTASFAQKQNDFKFLLGSWEMKTAKGRITENWLLKNGILTGNSYKHNLKGDSTLSESVEIKQIKGQWNYCVTAYEGTGLHQVNFVLIKNANGELKFQNKKNDFPQNITYVDKGKNELYAYIDGVVNGKVQEMKFPYTRKK